LQEIGRDDLRVIAISSPTSADSVVLEIQAKRRLAFYSSRDPIIESRVANWPQVASLSSDLEWLDHDTDQYLKYVARIVDWYVEGFPSGSTNSTDRLRRNRSRMKSSGSVWQSFATEMKFGETMDGEDDAPETSRK
jgi:hypothetical protein